ncbi:MAG TPA: ThiF family adenylyltransferase [Gammaproteobacteria bacterium]|nr:ThiF family adenylyltransferase [Gammaproteobacteria bacterium]
MKTTRIAITERDFNALRNLIFDTPGVEGAAFLLCGQADANLATKLIVHAVIPVASEDYALRERYRLSITSRALMRVAKLANYERLSVIFVHSHPGGYPDFSEQDDREEEKLMPFLQARVPNRIHGTMVVSDNSVRGRLYAPHRIPVDAVFQVGEHFRLWSSTGSGDVEPFFDRQVRAFGKETQQTLRQLTVGVVGASGTGSPSAEQAYRLGIGRILLFDGDVFDKTNINRVYGSSIADHGKHKVEILKRHLDRIGLPTEVVAVPSHISYEDAAAMLRNCDVVFSCPDKQLPRGILTNLALKYCIPVFDLGVLIDSKNDRIRNVYGRVTTLFPGEACLFCRGRISVDAIRVETLSPEERKAQIEEGYAPELEGTAPSVISFTTTVASTAVTELLHRLTGFMGKDRASTEVLLAFDESRMRTNRLAPLEDCFCSERSQWGRGDETPLLGMVWPSRTK